ncbi:MAG: zinc ABC transporter substrate-binding protein [Anaerolineales bacterium]|nr:zinc ABC transporter substrate-binding protein [Anaerolineales bacterium]MBS3752780.1 zinc ABC transporter substrate-binding protein [Anaerolineales bacterium]
MDRKRNGYFVPLIFLLILFCLSACAPAGTSTRADVDGKLKAVATTTFVGDVVSRVGGEHISLTVLLPYGANPHSFQPSPQDVAAVNRSDVIFANGVGLEVFLEDLIENAGGDAEVVHVSEGIDLRSFPSQTDDGHDHEEGEDKAHDDAAEQENGGSDDHDHDPGEADPHVWFDPTNVMVWVDNIQETLTRIDPANEDRYQENAQTYRAQLEDLDSWIRDQVTQIPEDNRYIVTDHTVFGYFAEEYGFQQVGAVIPSPTTEAQPSGKHLAELSDTIREYAVKAIFVGKDFDPSLSQRIAEDTGVKLVQLYFGSLTEDDGPAGTYIEFMRYNVKTIVEALR